MAKVEPGKAKAAGIVGILLLCFGLAIVICGFVWISYGGGDGTGIWSGIGIVIAGILGIVTWLKLNKIAMIFFLILCILEIILLAVQCILALLVWLVWQLVIGWVESSCNTVGKRCVCKDHTLPMEVENCDWVYAVEATFIAVVILSAFGSIVSFAGSIIGCMGVCCASNEAANNTTVIVQQPVAMVPQGSVMVTTSGQAYPQQGSAAPPAYSQQDQGYQTKPSVNPAAPPGAVSEDPNAYPMAAH